MCFFTNRFKVRDIIDRSVLIHESPDDYRTQPAGRSGRRLACGVVRYTDLSENEMLQFDFQGQNREVEE